MQRFSQVFLLENVTTFIQKALSYAQYAREIVFLHSNQHQDQYSSYDAILAFDAFTSIETDAEQAFDKLSVYQKETKDWLFGYLTYDLKNEIFPTSSLNTDGLQFKDLVFFQPQKLLLFRGNEVEFLYLNVCKEDISSDYDNIRNEVLVENISKNPQIQQRICRETYLEKVNFLKNEIHLGNVYEANFCMEFFAEGTEIDPLQTFWALNNRTKAPFASFLKVKNHYALSGSPERYLKKLGQQLVSQPIKGTAKRDENPEIDAHIRNELQKNPKERAENIMVVDLVRNDLSKTALKNTVQVTELCEVYSYQQVHQMISTITSTIDLTTAATTVLATTFPMGSMTGMPKQAALDIIERLEETQRGLYSGAIGYFTPENDFDFNVVIRTILYNHEQKYVSFSVGSAITFEADAAQEYEECLLKAQAMKLVLGC